MNMGGDLAPNLGGTKKFFRGPISGKISIFLQFLMTFFYFFSRIFRMFTKLNVVYDHFLTKKHNFSLCSCFHAHPTTLLLKILGGPMHGRSPHLKFGGSRPP